MLSLYSLVCVGPGRKPKLLVFSCTGSYGKNPSNIFSKTNRLISMKLGMKHPWLKYYNVYINHDPVMTLTKFMARSTWVAHAFEWEKLLKCHLKGKARRKFANHEMDRILIILKKEIGPRASSVPALGLNTIIFKHVYWYMQQTQVSVYRTIGPLVLKHVYWYTYMQISGERLQDHWSSGFMCALKNA